MIQFSNQPNNEFKNAITNRISRISHTKSWNRLTAVRKNVQKHYPGTMSNKFDSSVYHAIFEFKSLSLDSTLWCPMAYVHDQTTWDSSKDYSIWIPQGGTRCSPILGMLKELNMNRNFRLFLYQSNRYSHLQIFTSMYDAVFVELIYW